MVTLRRIQKEYWVSGMTSDNNCYQGCFSSEGGVRPLQVICNVLIRLQAAGDSCALVVTEKTKCEKLLYCSEYTHALSKKIIS